MDSDDPPIVAGVSATHLPVEDGSCNDRSMDMSFDFDSRGDDGDHTSDDEDRIASNDNQIAPNIQEELCPEELALRALQASLGLDGPESNVQEEDHVAEQDATDVVVASPEQAELDIETLDTNDNAAASLHEPTQPIRTNEPQATEPAPRKTQDQPLSQNVEVLLQPISPSERHEYVEVVSDIVDFVKGEDYNSAGLAGFSVEFTDGREELLTHNQLLAHKNGPMALHRFYTPSNEVLGKRKRPGGDDFLPGERFSSPESFVDDLDDEEEHRRASRPMRSSRVTTHYNFDNHSQAELDDDEDEDIVMQAPRRSTRERRRPPIAPAPPTEDMDELQQSGDDPDHIPFITSDVSVFKPGQKGRYRRLTMRGKLPGRSRNKSPASDIEFDAPRRSNRSTRHKYSMGDDDAFDEESLYLVQEKPIGPPKAISIREVYRQIDPQSSFAAHHHATCHTCRSSQSSQLIYCQGCSLTYHKSCIGYRSGREHMVTKIGDSEFVLQCKFCIGLYEKKDVNAPKYDRCQECKLPGKACKAFSEKKTSRQEEKLREENGGIDPITPVNLALVNNGDVTLFRCVKCHRGWHFEHLPPIGEHSPTDDVRSERLKDYSIDWQCNDCRTARRNIHRLVAWRPTDLFVKTRGETAYNLSYSEVSEDDKEYLVKYEGQSYAHCKWKAGAWVFGTAATVSRNSFAKKDAEKSLLIRDEKQAIPDEYLMPDVILHVKWDKSAPRSESRAEELANVGYIQKIFVKFQGLGYGDVVWDRPPTEDSGKDIHNAFLEAFYDYLEGKYFEPVSHRKVQERVKQYKAAPYKEVTQQPKGLQQGTLMGYQIEGLNWMLDNFHCGRSVVLADEMGLGKTVQVVALVTSLIQDHPQIWPFLIVVPNATCPNWRREFKRWVPDLRVVTYHGGRAPQELAYKYELFPEQSSDMMAHVVIMSYDSAADPNTKNLFKNVHWQGLVVDEGQRLKNDSNLLYGALKSMRIPFRLLLTGTPLQNNKRELFNLLQFIDDTQNAAKLDEKFAVLDKETLPKLHEKIRPYFLRRTKASVLKFLPPMAQIIIPVSMTVIQEKLSKSIMAKNPQLIQSMFANSKMSKKERGSLNNILMQLRKCLCHPFIYSDAIEERHHDQVVLHRNLVEASAKLILLQIMLPKLKERGHRVLIFSQFLQQLDIVEDFLVGLGFGYRRLDGQISSLEKQRRIDAFNAPDSELFAFLLSTRAGGVGINLATADTVIIMDPDFNPHQDIQALSRAHRIGQKKKVLCFQLVTKDSVEERIMQIGRKKMALDHALIESMDDDDLAGDDLESILQHGAKALFDENYQKDAIVYDSASVDKLLDRSVVEQTETTEEGSAETQFSYAKVWANEKSGFDNNLGTSEEAAPEPLKSSVWDQILAQREEEARKEAEAKKEVLGRGGRRRAVVDNNANAAAEAAALLGQAEADSADSSDAYSGSDEGEESEDEAEATKGRKPKQTSKTKPASASTPSNKSTPKKQAASINKQNKQTPKTKQMSCPKRKISGPQPQAAAAKAASSTAPKAQTPRKRAPTKGRQAIPPKQLPTPAKTPSRATSAAATETPTKRKPTPACPPTPSPMEMVEEPLTPASVDTSETVQ
ncbi:PHD/FYVE-zinc-finger like domain-containing protein [Emericellopsis atlantica]|uniref:PHD/FYVE-zinc-finger like domain-containing protein n=1 Tax=Emericellopsis atlantica TaxID=2614577 RepID=A0A9P8CLB9_9HYPO|nr:PHD/FYVE-zinc-finger like domain-containing protein [Emericellopsis atlantica]KAG9251233.1 PHD/FYVE-zinc-finger like domain-containing protein [Emericellopsis atlantica]